MTSARDTVGWIYEERGRGRADEPLSEERDRSNGDRRRFPIPPTRECRGTVLNTTPNVSDETTVVSPPLHRPAPLQKWAGGKRKLLPHIIPLLLPFGAPSPRRYFEPFVGGGAVFFELAAIGRAPGPANCVLADVNEEMMQTYRVVQRSPYRLIAALKSGLYVNDEKTFYAIRALDPEKMDLVDAAARFLYLNRTCFNGLYRVNRAGGFNVPFGRYANPPICNEGAILAANAALQLAVLHSVDFRIACEERDCGHAGEGDAVYFDPPYLPVSKTSDFTAYSKSGFCLEDHIRLRDLCIRLARRGARVVISNSSADAIRALYAEEPFSSLFIVEEIMAARAINSDGGKRGKVVELLAYTRQS